jgi:hypothetical protein
MFGGSHRHLSSSTKIEVIFRISSSWFETILNTKKQNQGLLSFAKKGRRQELPLLSPHEKLNWIT